MLRSPRLRDLPRGRQWEAGAIPARTRHCKQQPRLPKSAARRNFLATGRSPGRPLHPLQVRRPTASAVSGPPRTGAPESRLSSAVFQRFFSPLRRFRRVLCCAWLPAAWLLASPAATGAALAQPVALPRDSTSSTTPAPPADLHVRAPRPLRPAGQLDAAGPVTVLAGADLRRTYTSPTAALADQPGLAVMRTGGVGSPAHLMVRGSTADQVAVAIDDVPLSNADGAPFDLSDLPLSAVERLEVYRGATPAWLGPQSMGGALRILLRKARGTSGEFSAAMGSFGTRQLEGGLGWQGDRASALLGARWLGTNGDFAYRQDPGTAYLASDDLSKTRQNNDLTRLGGTLAADWRLNDRWTAYLRYLGAGSELGVPGAALYPALHARYEQNRQLLALQAVRQAAGAAGRWLLSVHSSGAWTQTDDRAGELGLAWHARQRVAGAGATAAWEGPLSRTGRVAVDGQARLAGQAAAVDGEDLLRGEARPRSWRTSAALTAALPVRIGDLTVTPAGGAEWIAQSLLDARQYPFEWTEVSSGQAPPWHAALSAQWQPQPGWVLHSSARRAVRLANLQELFGDSAVVRGNARLRPESSVSLDAGLNWQRRGGQRWDLSADARGYVTWADDLIQLVGLGARQAVYQNIGEARLLGAELQVDGRLGPLRASVGHATLATVDRSQQVAYRGKALPLWPRSRWSGRLSWQLPAASRDFSAALWTAGQWQAGYFLDSANLVALPGRALVSAGMRGEFPRAGLHVDVRLDNAADVPWFDLVGYPLPGRTAWLQVGWSGRQDPL